MNRLVELSHADLQGWLIALLVGLLMAVCTPAHAFHTGRTFGEAPGAGGGGGLYYVGAPRERGWTCTACHHDAPGKLRVRFATDAFSSFTYVPSSDNEITIRIENERLGMSAGLSNFNGMVLSVFTAEGQPAGTFTNAAADQYEVRSSSRGDLAIASAGRQTGVTEWRFTWVAPPAGTGPVTLYLGVVDGNGANSAANETLTDPFGDDVYTAKVTLQEAAVTASVQAAPPLLPTWPTPLHQLAILDDRRRRRRRQKSPRE